MSTTVEHAVKMPGQKKFHRLQPDALIGTLRCGSGGKPGPTRWQPVIEVLPSQRCQRCFKAGA